MDAGLKYLWCDFRNGHILEKEQLSSWFLGKVIHTINTVG